jgi:SAM-dependent methyltransferase
MEWFEDEDFWREFYPYMFSSERFAAAKEEVNRIEALTQCKAGKVLDLCCGPGRHAVEFAQRGFEVTGVDRSEFLLQQARGQASGAGVAVEWVMEDMRQFLRPATFDLACSLFTSFGYFQDEEDDLRVLRNLHQNLKQTGVLVIEVLGKERLARTWQSAICTQLPDGALMLQRPQLRDNCCRVHSDWTMIRAGHARHFSFDYSIYSGRELVDRLRACGFVQVQLFGDLLGSPYDLEAMRLVAVARKSSL